jgi:lipoprotein-anchoring transpeptidase ErfK/SrfK
VGVQHVYGNGQVYYSNGSRQIARTPRGRFAIYRQIDAVRVAPLGVLNRPKYFYGGYAIHGSASIPGYPASHGCARLSNAAIDYVWAADLAPIGRRLWIY